MSTTGRAGIAGAAGDAVVGSNFAALVAVDAFGPALMEKELQTSIVGGKVPVEVPRGILFHRNHLHLFNVIPVYQIGLRASRGTSPIPKPYQKPYPPMLLPVDSQESFVPMGAKGYKIAIGAGSSPHNLRGSSVLREDVESYRKAWIDAGHPGDPKTVVRVPTVVADTKAKADRRAEDLMNLARIYYAGRSGIGSTDAGSGSPDQTAEANLFGTPEEVVDKIHMFSEAFNADEIMFECNWTSSVPREVVMDTLRCITDKVIPAFK